MHETSLLYRYLPLAIASVLPVLIIWDASVRRRSRGAGGSLQLVIGVILLLIGGVLVANAVLNLARYTDAGPPSSGPAIVALASVFTALALICVIPLAIGLVRPARPTPRRGLTLLTLAVCVGICVVGAVRVLPHVADAVAELL